jgi:acetyltransferase-like isoleucine patch superfamily enzyme
VSHFAELGLDCIIQEHVILGLQYRVECEKVRIGDNAVIRAFTIIYADVELGNDVKTGHHVLIREHTRIGNRVVVGSETIIDGYSTIGDFVKIEGRVYIPTHTTIGNYVFIGPGAVLTNDKYPLRRRDEYEPRGPVIEDNVSIGGNATILPGVRLSEGSMIAAGSVVTRDVPPWHLAVGVPARSQPLPEFLKEPNRAKRW